MKTISRTYTDATSDFKTVVPALQDAYKRLVTSYDEETHPKLRILDNFVILCAFSFIVQIVYMIVVRTKEPLNALMAGCFCSLGMFALTGKYTVTIIQLTDAIISI